MDRLDNLPLYSSLHPGLDQAAAFLRRFDPATPDGRIDLDGDRLFVLVQSYVTHPPATRQFEAHRRYLDVQCVVAGRERIDVRPVSQLRPEADFDEGRDIGFFIEPAGATSLILETGDFALLLPGEAHKPCCTPDLPAPVRKVVFKLLVDERGSKGRRP